MIQTALITTVKVYRLFLSPWLGAACRFAPTCSVYAIEALEKHGSAKGGYLTLHRLARCHPWCDAGYDPVPSLFSFMKQTEVISSSTKIADTQ
jgi:putative membrane protein insertion efficiency factor